MEQEQNMGLATDKIFSELESSEGIESFQNSENAMRNMTADEFLNGGNADLMFDSPEVSFTVSAEEELAQMKNHYDSLIAQMLQDHNSKIADLSQNNQNNSSQSNNNDVQYLLKIIKMVSVRLSNKQYERAIQDIEMTIEEFEGK